MFLRAVYEPTGESYYVNLDFIVDALPYNDGYILYTIDNERGGYLVNKDDFERAIKEMEDESNNK